MLQGLHLNIPFIFAMLCAILHTKSRLSKLPQHVQCSAERVLSPCMHKWLPLQLESRLQLPVRGSLRHSPQCFFEPPLLLPRGGTPTRPHVEKHTCGNDSGTPCGLHLRSARGGGGRGG